MTLKIGSLIIPPEAGFSFRQTIDIIEARNLRRSKNGTLSIQSRWQKLQSTIAGSGWLPDGLDAIDNSISHAVHCIESLGKASGSNVITIPRAFRTDAPYSPQGVAVINDESVATPLSLIGNVATLTTVAGASQYQVLYYPIITGAVTISRQFDEDSQTWSWNIEVIES